MQEKRIVDELMELVQIDSETKHERAICDVLLEKLTALGLDVKEDDTAAKTGHGAGNIIATLPAKPGKEQAPPLLFTAHMDTVVPGRGVKPRLDDDGYIRSDGTTILGSDDKAGLAAMLEAIQVLKERKLEHGFVQFIITAGEEAGLVGAQALNKNELKATYGFALDSNEKVGAIAVAAPYQTSMSIEIRGRSAHAGVNPENGISSIQVAGKAISKMRLGRIDHETSANIGSFEGRGPTNIVCDYVKLLAEARSINPWKLDRQVEQMRFAFQQACDTYGAELTFTTESSPGFYFEPTDGIVQLAYQAIRKIGRKPSTFHSGGGSDANIFNAFGVPTVNLAVGYEQIHTTKEQMPVSELIKIAELVVALIDEATK